MKKHRFTRGDKRAKIRGTVIRIAADLFEKRGFDNVYVEEIAAEAEVSRSTFYRHFPTKEHVAFPYHEEYVACFNSLLAEHNKAVSPLLTVRNAFLAMAEKYMEIRDEHLRYRRIITASPALVARSVALDMDWEKAIAESWKKKIGRVPNAQ